MADVAEDDGANQKPRWFTPRRLLLIFCITNLVVYLDRGGRGACCCAGCRAAYACRTHVKPTGSTTMHATYRGHCKQWSEWIAKNRAATPGLWHTGARNSSSSSMGTIRRKCCYHASGLIQEALAHVTALPSVSACPYQYCIARPAQQMNVMAACHWCSVSAPQLTFGGVPAGLVMHQAWKQ
jgi:hypothetical protein